MAMRALALTLGLGLLTVSVGAQAANTSSATSNPYIGTWIEDTQRTTYGPGQKPPLFNMHKWEAWDGDGLKCTILIVDADGTEHRAMYFQKFDGNWYPVIGEERRDAISARRIDEFTFQPSSRRGGVGGDAGGRHVFSEDGNTITVMSRDGTPGRVYKKVF